MATSRPFVARRPAHTSPAGPAPITITSKLRSLMAAQSRGSAVALQAVADRHALVMRAIPLLVGALLLLVGCGGSGATTGTASEGTSAGDTTTAAPAQA